MADEAESAPVKRGPGRPRKVVQEAVPEPKVEVKSDPDDPRIGRSVDPAWSQISFADGEYRIEGGVIVEKI